MGQRYPRRELCTLVWCPPPAPLAQRTVVPGGSDVSVAITQDSKASLLQCSLHDLPVGRRALASCGGHRLAHGEQLTFHGSLVHGLVATSTALQPARDVERVDPEPRRLQLAERSGVFREPSR